MMMKTTSSSSSFLLLLLLLSSSSSSSSSLFSPRMLVEDACGGCNSGICVEPTNGVVGSSNETTTTTITSESSSSLGKQSSCDCRHTGYVGTHCQIPCSKKCLHGGKCIPPENTNASNQDETCACAKAVVDGNPYAGNLCEYGATQSCMTLGSTSKHSFCTNGGTCGNIVNDNEEHVPCICPTGYVGSKCEYLEGNAPASYTSTATRKNSTITSSSSMQQQQQQQEEVQTQSVIFFAVIVAMACMIIIILLGLIVRTYRRTREERRQEHEARRATEDFAMVPMNENSRRGAAGGGDGGEGDEDDDEDGII